MTETWRDNPSPPSSSGDNPTIRTEREAEQDADEPPVRWNPTPLPNTRPPVHEGRVLQPGESHPDDKIPKAGEPHYIHETTGRVVIPEDQRSTLHTHATGASHAGPDLIASVTEPVVPDEEPPPPKRQASETTKDTPSRAGYRGK
jgi:hypothetical protein